VKIGDSVLGTYRRTNGSSDGAFFVDERATGFIASRRMPLGFYWLNFVTPHGEVLQMNHESEIGGDPRDVMPKLRVLMNVRAAAKAHIGNGGGVQWYNGDDYRQPNPAKALQELSDIGQDDVIL
jgi:hypothetical protein